LDTEKVRKVRYLGEAGIELLNQEHMKNTDEFLYVTVKNRKLFVFDGVLWVELLDKNNKAWEAINNELQC